MRITEIQDIPNTEFYLKPIMYWSVVTQNTETIGKRHYTISDKTLEYPFDDDYCRVTTDCGKVIDTATEVFVDNE